MLLSSFTQIIAFPSKSKGEKGKLLLQHLLVLTRRPRRIETADVPKLIQRVETAPLATETTPTMSIEAIADSAREPKSEKVAEKVAKQPKMLVTALPKLSATTTGTPMKTRMASVLDVVLESVKIEREIGLTFSHN
jgi:hypothetical protein